MHFKVYFDDETAQRLTAAPEAMAEKFAAIPALTDAFCAQPLDAELRSSASSARRQPSPLPPGAERVWVAAAEHAVGRVNDVPADRAEVSNEPVVDRVGG